MFYFPIKLILFTKYLKILTISSISTLSYIKSVGNKMFKVKRGSDGIAILEGLPNAGNFSVTFGSVIA